MAASRQQSVKQNLIEHAVMDVQGGFQLPVDVDGCQLVQDIFADPRLGNEIRLRAYYLVASQLPFSYQHVELHSQAIEVQEKLPSQVRLVAGRLVDAAEIYWGETSSNSAFYYLHARTIPAERAQRKPALKFHFSLDHTSAEN